MYSINQSSRYKSNDEKCQTLLLEHYQSQANATKHIEFNIKLKDPLLIDEQSDIYLDSFITKGYQSQDKCYAFMLYIDEFNIKSKHGVTNNLDGSQCDSGFIYIPNNIKDGEENKIIIHKGKKNNFVSTINPIKLTELNGRISILRDEPTLPLSHSIHNNVRNHGGVVGDFVFSSPELASDASEINNMYKGMEIVISRPDASGIITEYNGATKVASVDWHGDTPTLIPDETTYDIMYIQPGLTSDTSVPLSGAQLFCAEFVIIPRS